VQAVQPKRTWKAQMKKRVDNNESNAILTKNAKKKTENKKRVEESN
jgi:hypothetical protein